jgi:hypothetical protein
VLFSTPVRLCRVLVSIVLGASGCGLWGCQSCVEDGSQPEPQATTTGVPTPRPGSILRVQPHILAPRAAIQDAGALDE